MQKYFKEEYFLQAKRQRNKSLIIYFTTLAVYLAISAIVLVIYRNQPYKSDKILLIKIVNGIFAGLYVIFSFIYLKIPFKRVNKYYKMCFGLVEGLKTTSIGSFVEENPDLYYKDGVDMKTLIFLEWSEKKQDYYERRVLIFYEKPTPQIPSGAEVKYITKGNVLLEYEIIKGDTQGESNIDGNW